MTRCAPFALLLICAASLAAAQTPSFRPLAVQPTRAVATNRPAATPAAAQHPSFKPLATQPTRSATSASPAAPARAAAPTSARPAAAPGATAPARAATPAPSRPVATPPARMVAPAPAVAPVVTQPAAAPAPSIYDVPAEPAPAPARAAQPVPWRAASGTATNPTSTPGTRVVLDPEWPANELERGRPVSRAGRPPLFSGGVPDSWQMHEWRLSAGAFLAIDGKVKETFRSLYAAMGEDYKQALAETYDLDDFGVDPPYWTLGVAFERQWRVFAFRWDLHYLAFSTDATAVRDYYIGLFGDKISYNGRKYDHIMIPKGRKFSADFNGVLTDFLFSFTPFTLAFNERVRFAPFVEAGAALIGGNFKLDAGETTGTTVYQNPPVNFAVGGNSSSFLGIGAPMGGVGAKLEVGDEYATRWFLAGRFDAFTYKGSSKLFTSSSHRDKKLDITFLDISAETGFIHPWGNKELIYGVRYQLLDLSGSIKSKAEGKEAIIAARERFDKDVDFSTSVLTIFAGIRF